jgi:putative transposase
MPGGPTSGLQFFLIEYRLQQMPKSVQGKAKQLIHEMYLAPTRKAALAAYDQFISSYQIKFPKPANA